MSVEDDVPDCAGDEESVTFKVNVELPTAAGVPLMAPVAGFNVRPAGSEPEVTLQVTGFRPPEAESTVLYAAPDTASGTVLPEMCRPVATVRDSDAVAV